MSSDESSIQSQFNLNTDNSNSELIYNFENFRLDARLLLLYKDGTPLALAPKVVETLLALIERAGEIVSKREMMKRLWADSFVEDANLTQNIYLLRKTLGKGGDGRDLIETFRRRGYRFTGEIRRGAGGQASAARDLQAVPADLRAGQAAPHPNFNSLAVLPMASESADETAEYLSDGITESVINRLSQLAGLRVVARSTAFRYKNMEIEPLEVGRQLGVGAVVTGRILQFGDRFIIRTELIDAANGWQIWGGQYERRTSDALELQETIAREISEHLHLKLTGEDQRRLAMRYTKNSEAYRLFIKARYFLNKRLTATIEQAASLFQQAIELDPTFAPAYVGLADCYPLLSLYGALTPHKAYPKAKAAAEKALEIDDRYTKAYNSLGVVKLFYEWDWAGAESAFRRAIELNPGYPDAHQRYGMFLTAVGRFDEAAAELEKAQALDPLSPIIRVISAYPFYYSRRFDEAGRRLREVVAADENYSMAHFRLGLTLLHQGKYPEAIAEIEKAVLLSDDRDSIAALGYAQGKAGHPKKALAALATLEEREKAGFVTSYNRVLVHIGLGNYEAALDWLERCYDERSYWLIYLRSDPALDALRDSSRFKILQERIFGGAGLADAQPAPSINEKPIEIPAQKKPSARRGRFLVVAFIVLLLAAFALALVYWRSSKASSAENPAPVALRRLTPDINAFASALSPDGKYLAYIQIENEGRSLWVKDLTAGAARQLLPPADENRDSPQFSPDGSQIYYTTSRKDVPNGLVMRIPLAGGSPELIAQNLMSPIAVSPDASRIAFVRSQSLIIASTDGSGERILSERDLQNRWFESWGSPLSWSPDGKKIAICGAGFYEGKRRYELTEISVADASERQIPVPDWSYLDGVQWIPDGSGLIVIAQEKTGSPFQVYRIDYPSGTTTRLTQDFHDYRLLSLSADSRQIVTSAGIGNRNIWIAPLADARSAKQITFGTAANDGYFGAELMPDGRIVYTSPRSGHWDLWIMNSDGSNQQQMTVNAGINIRPSVSPDGRYIFFEASRNDTTARIWRIDADGANPKQMTDGEGSQGYPFVSPDGEWFYFTWNVGLKGMIWKAPVEGGAPVRVSALDNAGLYSVSPDGSLIAFLRYDEKAAIPWQHGILRIETGEIVRMFDQSMAGRIGWTPDSKAVIYIDSKRTNLWQQPIDGAPPKQLTNFDTQQLRGFHISADGKTLVVSRGNVSYEAVLIENF